MADGFGEALEQGDAAGARVDEWVRRGVDLPRGRRQSEMCGALGSDTNKDPGPWEGEQRNMWKPTQQEGLWFHGGNLHQSRHYSLYLAS